MPDESRPPFDHFSVEIMIDLYGDQAYHKGVQMAAEALAAGDRMTCRALGPTNIELIRRGYHKKPNDSASTAPNTTKSGEEDAREKERR